LDYAGSAVDVGFAEVAAGLWAEQQYNHEVAGPHVENSAVAFAVAVGGAGVAAEPAEYGFDAVAVAVAGVVLVAVADWAAVAVAAVGTAVVENVLIHGPARRSGPHVPHGLPGHHAYSCQPALQALAKQQGIGLGGVHWAYLVIRHSMKMVVFPYSISSSDQH
jgi:hypothetical protein